MKPTVNDENIEISIDIWNQFIVLVLLMNEENISMFTKTFLSILIADTIACSIKIVLTKNCFKLFQIFHH